MACLELDMKRHLAGAAPVIPESFLLLLYHGESVKQWCFTYSQNLYYPVQVTIGHGFEGRGPNRLPESKPLMNHSYDP